jgi:hypothetical protein
MTITNMIQVLDHDKGKNRATVLLNYEGRMFFGLVIERVRFNRRYTCLYVGLTRDEYRLLIKQEAFVESVSFLGISSDPIDMYKRLSDALILDQPTHYVGIICPPMATIGEELLKLSDSVWMAMVNHYAG